MVRTATSLYIQPNRGLAISKGIEGLTPNCRNSDNKGLETLKLLCEIPMGMKVLKRRKRAANSYCKATMILFNICELRYVDCR